ncbi:MAG TPA: protein translocase subunit SecD [Candidatus Dormibacteraeota bacterium]|nr:protein translocase subunit SecD [Candidatus Dormibacteraeota bacterium]
MIKLNRWWFGVVAVIVVLAIFVDGYSYIWRITTGKSLSQTITSPPSLLGHDLYIHKGLDLSGGTEVVVAICQGPNTPEGSNCRNGLPPGVTTQQAVDSTITVLQRRVNGLGVSEATVQQQGDGQILVQLPGVDVTRAKDVLGRTEKLYFATPVANAGGAATPTEAELVADQQGRFNPQQITDANSYPSGYHWKIDTTIDASDVTGADTTTDTSHPGFFAVTINFDGKGADEWSKITNAAYQAGQGTALNRVAIFLDNDVITAPGVVSPSSSSTEITGNFTAQAAGDLASAISAGSLPADIGVIQTTSVSATLGSDTVHRSLIAGLVGLIVVVLFMLGYYRFPGALASLALLMYAAIVLALYKLFGVTITLAGLAGFVLSVGMAVDANVLIFERTRDELRHGRSTALAVEQGFKRAWPAIRDSNVSTMIACGVLIFFGSSVVKGFAITLLIGVAVSMFSAILITQSLFHLVLGWRRARDPKLYTELRETGEGAPPPPSGRFDIVRNRNVFFAASLVIIIPGIIAIIAWGFRLGLDFAGGNRLDVKLARPATATQVTDSIDKVVGVSAAQPQVQTEQDNQFSIQTLPDALPLQPGITQQLQNDFGIARDSNGKLEVSQTSVGPTVARSLVISAIYLVFFSSIFIAGYLAYRFGSARAGRGQLSRWRFSICTLFKLLHDVFVLAGLWAIVGHFSSIAQVDSLFVTAVLTSVAFSIHDTIVVFDRVRENLRTGPRYTFDQIINLSTVQTMTRSLNTALTVTFVLLALVLFGGSTIQGFVLALLIGIVTGTYSSIFNASTLLVAWNAFDADSAEPAPPGRPTRVARARA